MTTSKIEVFIGLQHENCYLVGEVINLWWGNKNFWWGMSKFFASGRGTLFIFWVEKTLLNTQIGYWYAILIKLGVVVAYSDVFKVNSASICQLTPLPGNKIWPKANVFFVLVKLSFRILYKQLLVFTLLGKNPMWCKWLFVYVLSLSKLETVLVHTVRGHVNGKPQMIELHFKCCTSHS